MAEQAQRPPYPPAKSADDSAVPQLALRPKDAAKALSIGERKLWELTADRTSGIPYVRFGKAILYPVRELRDWLGRQAEGAKR